MREIGTSDSGMQVRMEDYIVVHLDSLHDASVFAKLGLGFSSAHRLKHSVETVS